MKFRFVLLTMCLILALCAGAWQLVDKTPDEINIGEFIITQ